MKKYILLFVLVSIALLSACKPASETPQNIGQKEIKSNTPFTLYVGETVNFKAINASIKLISVESDSRCPKGVNCIWQGDATVKVITTGFPSSNTANTLSLTKKMDLGKDENGTNYYLELTNLNPYPESGKIINPAEYQATMKLIEFRL